MARITLFLMVSALLACGGEYAEDAPTQNAPCSDEGSFGVNGYDGYVCTGGVWDQKIYCGPEVLKDGSVIYPWLPTPSDSCPGSSYTYCCL